MICVIDCSGGEEELAAAPLHQTRGDSFLTLTYLWRIARTGFATFYFAKSTL